MGTQKTLFGKGYATEAAKAVRDMAEQRLNWKRLISLIVPGNSRSIAVATRIGGKREKSIPFRGDRAEIFVYRLSPYDTAQAD